MVFRKGKWSHSSSSQPPVRILAPISLLASCFFTRKRRLRRVVESDKSIFFQQVIRWMSSLRHLDTLAEKNLITSSLPLFRSVLVSLETFFRTISLSEKVDTNETQIGQAWDQMSRWHIQVLAYGLSSLLWNSLLSHFLSLSLSVCSSPSTKKLLEF